jgi:hypothetical protein
VVTIPVAWQKGKLILIAKLSAAQSVTNLPLTDAKTMMALRKQAVRVGLIKQDTMSNLKFCSESEASALHCVSLKRMGSHRTAQIKCRRI